MSDSPTVKHGKKNTDAKSVLDSRGPENGKQIEVKCPVFSHIDQHDIAFQTMHASKSDLKMQQTSETRGEARESWTDARESGRPSPNMSGLHVHALHVPVRRDPARHLPTIPRAAAFF